MGLPFAFHFGMSKSDWALVGLNVFTLLMAAVGLRAMSREPWCGIWRT